MTWLDDEEGGDPFAEQLIAYDDQLAATPGLGGPPTSDLAPDVARELEPALECLRLLKELRVERNLGSTATFHQREDATIHAALIPGTIRFPALFGRFALRRELGRGGFGVVFLAWDPSLKREVALKLPRPDCLLTPLLKRRFLQEGHAAAGLEHPNIVTVYEAGETGGVCYIVSAYCPGPTLADWLKRQAAPIPPKTAAHLLAALADGIDHAHRRGILHRDVKPSNVLLQMASCKLQMDPEQSDIGNLLSAIPRITDFGLAKLVDGSGDQTRTGVMAGTPQFMAPEQVEGDSAAMGPPTDVYALGVILYELLTGRRPFAASSEMQTLRLISTTEPERPRRLRPQIPRDLETICLKCLQKEPRRRFASAADLAADLRRFLQGEPTLSRPPGTAERLMKWARRRPAVAALVGVCFVAALSSIAAGVWHVTQLASKNVELQAAVKDAGTQREAARLSAYGAHIRLASELHHNGQSGSMSEVLNRLRPAENETDLREFSWSYLWRLARNEQALRGHLGPVYSVAFSKDGRHLASGSSDTTVKLWDAETGRLCWSRRAFENPPESVVFSPDGRWLAAGDSETWHKGPMTIHVWDVQTGTRVASLDDAAGLPGALAFSPDSQIIAIPRRPQSDDASGLVLLWNLSTGEKRSIVPGKGVTMAATFSPDGKLLAAAYGPDTYRLQLHLLDVATGQSKAQFDGPTEKIQALAFAPDGKTLLSTSRDDTLRFWDVHSLRERINFAHADERVLSAAFSKNGRTLATLKRSPKGESDTTLTMRDSVTGKPVAEFHPSSYAIWPIDVSPDGQTIVLGCSDKIVRLRRRVPEPTVVPMPGHLFHARAIAFAPDGRTLASVGGDLTVRLADLATGKMRDVLLGHLSLVGCVAFDEDGRTVASGSYDTTVKLWDAAAGKLRSTLTGHTKPVRSVAFAPGGRVVASGSRDKTIKLWNVATGDLLATLEGHTSDVRGLAFSPDGRWLLSGGDDRMIHLWDVATQAKVADIEEPTPVQCVAFAPDGKLFAAGGRDGTINFWDLTTKEKRTVLGEHSASVCSIAFTPDGKTLASGSDDKTLRLWHVPTGQELICFKNQPHQVNSVAFTKDGKTLAAACEDGSIRLWPTEP